MLTFSLGAWLAHFGHDIITFLQLYLFFFSLSLSISLSFSLDNIWEILSCSSYLFFLCGMEPNLVRLPSWCVCLLDSFFFFFYCFVLLVLNICDASLVHALSYGFMYGLLSLLKILLKLSYAYHQLC